MIFMKPNRVLPVPDAQAAAHSARVAALIHGEMAACGGQISFARYMELALHAPGLGYYSAGAHKFGAAGDFVTAPELSALFSRCLARQCQQVLRVLDKANIIEVGGGSGRMACDVLSELEVLNCLPERYFILELSADLRARQRATLEQHIPHLLGRIEWLEGLPPPGFRGVILANELLDAMPVHLFRIADQGVPQEVFVASQNGRWEWRMGPLSHEGLAVRVEAIHNELGQQGLTLEAGYQSEINLAAEAWLTSMGEVLEAGLLLIIDYGFPRREYYHPSRGSGTLMCHYRHRAHADPLLFPGLQDITAHVDFTALAEAGSHAGLAVRGYTTQASFLIACGLAGMAGAPDDTSRHLALAQQINKLTAPSEMGELFKVMGFTKGLDDIPLLGFGLHDQRGRL